MAGLTSLLSGSAASYLEKVAGVAGLFVIAYLVISSVVGLFRRPASLPQQPSHDLGFQSAAAEKAVETTASRSGARSAVVDIIETIVMTVLIFAAVRLVIANFRIEGNSMEPNLHDGQYLIIEKVSYRFGDPQRGDVIVFHYPSNPKRDFIKRIIGLPGETVEVREGTVYINGRPLEEPYKPARGTYSWGPEVVPPHEYFVLGDNRNNSSDSHSWGFLPRSLIIGRAWFTYWPVQEWGFVPHYTFPKMLSLFRLPSDSRREPIAQHEPVLMHALAITG